MAHHNYIYVAQTKYCKHITLTPWVQNPATFHRQKEKGYGNFFQVLILTTIHCNEYNIVYNIILHI